MQDILEGSWVYQEMTAKSLEKGRQQGLEEGLEKGREEGRQQGIQAAQQIAISIVTARFPAGAIRVVLPPVPQGTPSVPGRWARDEMVGQRAL